LTFKDVFFIKMRQNLFVERFFHSYIALGLIISDPLDSAVAAVSKTITAKKGINSLHINKNILGYIKSK